MQSARVENVAKFGSQAGTKGLQVPHGEQPLLVGIPLKELG
tara:strand:- start:25 stop:147 length:123 start_codon:yes stop_codon:yes gene_type:complete